MKACKSSTLALKLQGFFSDYLPRQRALSRHTLLNYRDSLKLLLKFVAGNKGDPLHLAVSAIQEAHKMSGRQKHRQNIRLETLKASLLNRPIS